MTLEKRSRRRLSLQPSLPKIKRIVPANTSLPAVFHTCVEVSDVVIFLSLIIADGLMGEMNGSRLHGARGAFEQQQQRKLLKVDQKLQNSIPIQKIFTKLEGGTHFINGNVPHKLSSRGSLDTNWLSRRKKGDVNFVWHQHLRFSIVSHSRSRIAWISRYEARSMQAADSISTGAVPLQKLSARA